MKARPLQNRIIVRPTASDDKTPAGIIIPDAAKEKPLEGRVLAVGVKVEEVHVEDIITYSKYAGTEMKLEDEEEPCLILSEDDVLAVLE
jgi:chaperonin GroES